MKKPNKIKEPQKHSEPVVLTESWLDFALVDHALRPHRRTLPPIAVLTLIALFPFWLFNTLSIFSALAILTLIALAVIDARTQHLPNVLVIALFILSFFQYSLLPPAWLHQLLGALLGGGLFLAIQLISKAITGRDSLGMGDVKLMVALGALTGWLGLPIVMLTASLSAGAILLYKRLITKNYHKDQKFAFGPYLCFGGYVSLVTQTVFLVLLSLFLD